MAQFFDLLVLAFAESYISIVSLSRVRFCTVSCCKRAMTPFRHLSLLLLDLLLLFRNIVIEVCLLVVAAVLLGEGVCFGWFLRQSWHGN